MTKECVVFTGCSFTAGDGWKQPSPANPAFYPADSDSQHLWVNLCHQGIPELSHLDVINAGYSGASNNMIFINTMEKISLLGTKIKKIFCQWTATHRYQWIIGNDEWSTVETWAETPNRGDVSLSTGEFYPRKYIEDVKLRFKVLHHLHWGIVEIVRYSSIIDRTCQHLGIECYHINGICPWDQDFFFYVSDPRDMLEKSTPFTKSKIINLENRNDDDARRRYANAHYDYKMAGGIRPERWINLYNSFNSSQIDTNLDQQHPGIESNLIYFQQIKDYFNQASQ